jgi:signal transduction histidine kinase
VDYLAIIPHVSFKLLFLTNCFNSLQFPFLCFRFMSIELYLFFSKRFFSCSLSLSAVVAVVVVIRLCEMYYISIPSFFILSLMLFIFYWFVTRLSDYFFLFALQCFIPLISFFFSFSCLEEESCRIMQ